MERYLLLALVLVFVIGGCSSDRAVAPQPSEEDQIREVVFRYQFEFNASGQGQSANTYFLRLEGDQDPSPQLLQRFLGHRPPVKPASASTLEAGTAQVVDSESRLPGLVFWIAEIRWLGGDEVEVDGGYDEASESAAGSVYHLERARGRWEVVRAQMLWIK
jgi:hypothetical protein